MTLGNLSLEEPLVLFDQLPAQTDVREEILAGLLTTPKRLPPKYFYDERGSHLFEQITQLPEYYLTRSELEILSTQGNAIADAIQHNDCLIEYGSGSSQKVRLILDALDPRTYVPVDISRTHLLDAATKINASYLNLQVLPVCADYSKVFELPSQVRGSRLTAFFPGSSIGNFDRVEAAEFLKSVHTVLGTGGRMILGLDKRKERNILEAAYNDSLGVTADFNLNILRHLNEKLDTQFDVGAFTHHAVYNDVDGRIEMYLRCNKSQFVQIDSNSISIQENELIHTENSYKYSLDELHALAKSANMSCQQIWEDSQSYFMVVLLEAL